MLISATYRAAAQLSRQQYTFMTLSHTVAPEQVAVVARVGDRACLAIHLHIAVALFLSSRLLQTLQSAAAGLKYVLPQSVAVMKHQKCCLGFATVSTGANWQGQATPGSV
jgi:hypothetical protein